MSSKNLGKSSVKTVWRNVAVAVFALCFALLGLCVTIIPTHAADNDDEPEPLLVTNPVLIGTVELGTYPQTYVGDTLNAELQGLGNDAFTGRTYTSTAGSYPSGKIDALKQVTWYEYEYQGQRYVKVDDPSPANTGRLLLPNGPTVEPNQTYFFAVEPITWDIFRQDNALFAVARDLLGSVSFVTLDGNFVTWQDSYLRNFLNTYFIQEAGLAAYTAPRTYYASTPESDTAGGKLTDQMWMPSYLEIQNFYTTDAERIKCHTGYELMSDNDANKGVVPFGADFYFTRTVHPTSLGSCCKVKDEGIAYTGAGTAFCEGFVPAFVLNDTAFQTLFTPDAEIIAEYDTTDHAVAEQATKPAWYNDAMTITYTKDGEPVNTVKDAGEYNATITLGNFTHDFKLTVTPRKVIVSGTITADSRAYNRDRNVTLRTNNVMVAGLIDGDGVTVDYHGVFADKNVGKAKPVTVTIKLLGTNADNYTLIIPDPGLTNVTADINPQTVVVDGVTVTDKEYDGTTRAILNTQKINFTGKQDGDDLTVAVSGEYRQATVGDHLAVTLTYVLDGADKDNYVVGGATTYDATGNIKPRVITVTINDQTVKVGDPLKLSARVSSGSIASGDNADDVYTLSIAEPTDPETEFDVNNLPAGEYTIIGAVAAGDTAKNYEVAFANTGKYTVLTAAAWDALQTKDDDKKPDNNYWVVIVIVIAVAAFIGALVGIGLVVRSHDRTPKPVKEKPAKKNKKDQGNDQTTNGATPTADNVTAKN